MTMIKPEDIPEAVAEAAAKESWRLGALRLGLTEAECDWISPEHKTEATKDFRAALAAALNAWEGYVMVPAETSRILSEIGRLRKELSEARAMLAAKPEV